MLLIATKVTGSKAAPALPELKPAPANSGIEPDAINGSIIKPINVQNDDALRCVDENCTKLRVPVQVASGALASTYLFVEFVEPESTTHLALSSQHCTLQALA